MYLTKSLVLLSPRAAEIDPKLSRNEFLGSNTVRSEDKIREKKNTSKKVMRQKLWDGVPGPALALYKDSYIRIQMSQIQRVMQNISRSGDTCLRTTPHRARHGGGFFISESTLNWPVKFLCDATSNTNSIPAFLILSGALFAAYVF